MRILSVVCQCIVAASEKNKRAFRKYERVLFVSLHHNRAKVRRQNQNKSEIDHK